MAEPVGNDLVPALQQRATLVAQLSEPDVSLARAAATYLMFKRRRLTEASERGYKAVLDDFTSRFSGARLTDFEPPHGALVVEDFLVSRYGHLAERTYNKALSVLMDLFSWHVARGTLSRNPVATIERAKARPVHRVTFSEFQVGQILDANRDPRDQIALRLLLHYGIRKGALRGIRFEHFDVEKRRLTVFTKGEKIHTLPVIDETVWRLLDEIGEPGNHYLLPRRKIRKRIPPRREELRRVEAALAEARSAADAAGDDPACSRELRELSQTLLLAVDRLRLALDAASTQSRMVLTEPRGEHGTHLWWYRCLTRAGIVAAGTTAGRRMHSARHTAIQRVLDKTGNLKAAQVLAGHAGVGTTGDIYSGWETGQLEGTMREVLPG